jgi:hypothetical protein
VILPHALSKANAEVQGHLKVVPAFTQQMMDALAFIIMEIPGCLTNALCVPAKMVLPTAIPKTVLLLDVLHIVNQTGHNAVGLV